MKPRLILATIAIVLFSYNNGGMVLGGISLDANTSFIRELERAAEIKEFEKEYVSRVEFVRSISLQHNPATSDSVISTIVEMSYQYNLPVELICATITFETARTWNPRSFSKAGAIGMMQIMPTTGADLAKEASIKDFKPTMLNDPILNIRLGCRFLDHLVSTYGIEPGLAGYNGGEVRARLAYKGKHDQLPAETRAYIPGVMKIYNEYAAL